MYESGPNIATEPFATAPGFCDEDIAQMRTEPEFAHDWLCHGYLAPGAVTLLTAVWKTGKTTMIAGLLAALKTGGEFCGHKLLPGKAFVISEEPRVHWLNRGQKLDLSAVRFLCRPFRGRPRPDQWEALVEHVAGVQRERGLDLVVIDSLAWFLPNGCENDAKGIMDFLQSLQSLTALGMSVLVLHHPRKKDAPAGRISRGSGALTAAIDILLEMYPVGNAGVGEGDRRRLLLGFSRYEATPVRLVVELDPARHEYIQSPNQLIDDFVGGWPVLHVVLEDALQKLTRQAILKQWPEDFAKPPVSSLWLWLERAVRDGLVLRDGLGRRSRPFRYWLPGQEDKWLEKGFCLPDLPDIDSPPDDAEETAKKLAEAGNLLNAKWK